MPKLFDAHTHAHFDAFKNDWKEVIGRALAADIGVINVGTQKDTSRRAVEVAEMYKESVYATIGLHPTHTSKSFHDAQELGEDTAAKTFSSRGEEFDYDFYKKLGKHRKVVAIGECGLDYYRMMNNELRIKQEKAFRAQIELAQEIKKPLMIHCRPSKGTDNAYEDALRILKSYKLNLKSVFHFYAGSPEMTKKLLAAGLYFTFGGVITFVRDYDASIALIPLDRIMLETDAPYVTPAPYRGKRNEPSYVIEVARKLAELKGVDFETVAHQTTENVKKVFGI